jgi:chromosome segregation ATPase
VKNRTRDIDRLHKRIDKRLDEIPSSGSRDKTSKRDVDNQDSDEGSYFQRWQDCQIELGDLKRREGSMLSKMKELQVKVDELSSALLRLQKEATDLRSKLKASETMISDLNKKK